MIERIIHNNNKYNIIVQVPTYPKFYINKQTGNIYYD